MGCNTPTLIKSFVGERSFGLKHGENCLLWNTIDDLLACVGEIMMKPKELEAIGLRGGELARERFTWRARMLEMLPYIDMIRNEEKYK